MSAMRRTTSSARCSAGESRHAIQAGVAGPIAASLDSLRGLAGNVDAMHQSIDQIKLLERLAEG